MKKKSILLMMAVFCMALSMTAVDPKITITAPSGSYPLFISQTVHIRWTHSAYYTGPGQTCRILCGSNIISPPVPVINDDFLWTVGLKHDLTYLAQGDYLITIENVDYNALNGPTVEVLHLPLITTTSPASGASLAIGLNHTIRWTHSPFFDYIPQELIICCGLNYIGRAPATSDQFLWQVGKREDGTFIAPGSYRIGYECSDYFSSGGVQINLFSFKMPLFRLLKTKIWIHKIPDCPMCFKLDPAQIKFDTDGPLVTDVELLRNGVLLAKLGRFGPRLAVPGPVKFNMEAESSRMKMRQKASYKLRFLSTKGKILHEQAVQVEIAK
ncbi:MAG: hypothetical protein MUP71_11365 [Candidatus Aminicenantes bacterium]|nr:hypothetical protein [Candidatus Aminicenantes bacterium]